MDVVEVILGPTASGKSALAIERAQELDGVIVNFDSMQIYDALHVLTAQPDAEDLSKVPHRLYGVIPPAQSCSAAKWVEMAKPVVTEIWEQNKTPILVGGTGLYIKALMHGLSPIPSVDPGTRAKLQQYSTEELTKLLTEYDPEMLQILKPNDTQRMIRALEVYQDTGKSIRWWQQQPHEGHLEAQYRLDIQEPERSWLYDRINRRVHIMLQQGALEEVKDLQERIERGDVPEDARITVAHGFQAFQSFLRGEKTLEQSIEQTQTESRQYAKRQMTFNRGQF